MSYPKVVLIGTTPGALIMLIAFVGFFGGHVNSAFGPDAMSLSGAIAVALVTWFTFLPSFVFILVGRPLVEYTHSNFRLNAPLTAITAVVVGVVVNLALFFGYRVLWPQIFSGVLDPVDAALLNVSALALFCLKQSIIRGHHTEIAVISWNECL